MPNWLLLTSIPATLDQEPEAVPAESDGAYWGLVPVAFTDAEGGAPAITGTAALDGRPGTMAADGQQAFSGTGALAGSSGAIAATGQEVFGGSATLVGQPGSLAATAQQSFAGAVALAGSPGAIDADATLEFAGASTLEGRAGELAAGAVQEFRAIAGSEGQAGELGAVGIVGEAEPEAITGSADLAGTSGDLTAIGEYTPLAITGEAALEGTPGELSAVEAIEQEQSPSAEPIVVVERWTAPRFARVEITSPEGVSPELLAELMGEEIAEAQATEALSSGEVATQGASSVPEVTGPAAGSVEVIAEIMPVEEVIPTDRVDQSAGVRGEDAAPIVPLVAEVVALSPDEVNALIDDEAGIVLAIVTALVEAGV